MENALWNGQLLIASDIMNDYRLEKEIRKASGRKELRCPDPDCQHPILRYCHGDIKEAFFAHLNNEQCDYANFDKENTQVMRTIRRIIYENFKSKGFKVRPEVKILDHHYTHLLFDMADCNQIAVEIGTQRLSANRIDKLTDEYRKKGIAVKWIVLGNTNVPVKENHAFFIKRYLLNESKNKDLLVVNWDCTVVAQYKVDPNKYEYNGRFIQSNNYPETYSEYATLSDLTFEDNELSLEGFKERYKEWIVKKRDAFNKKIKQLEDENKKRIEEIHNQEQKRIQMFSVLEERLSKLNKSLIAPPAQLTPTAKTSNISYEQSRQEILHLMIQQETQARDSLGRRWIKCEICGAVETEDKFGSYGGSNHINLGVCYDCSRGSRKSE